MAKKVKFWKDSWLPCGRLPNPLNSESIPEQNSLVKEFFISGTREWDATKSSGGG